MNEVMQAQGQRTDYQKSKAAAEKMMGKGMAPAKVAERLRVNPRRMLTAGLAGTLAGAIPAAMAMRDSQKIKLPKLLVSKRTKTS